MSIIFSKKLDTGREVVQNRDMNSSKKKYTTTARNIDALCNKLGDDWYDSVDGIYTGVKTWGSETETVRRLIAASCGDGDIVSWDTRDKDVQRHKYLRRRWSYGYGHEFYVQSHTDLPARLQQSAGGRGE